MNRSGEAKNAITVAKNSELESRRPEEAAPPVALHGASCPAEANASIPEPRTAQRSEACRTEPVAIASVPELPPSTINTDVRRRGINPVLTGVAVGIIVTIVGFLFGFAYLVVSYVRYKNG